MDLSRPIPLRPDRDAAAREWQRGFTRAATIRVLSQLRKSPAAEIERELKAAVVPLKQSDFPGSSVTRLLLLAPPSVAAQVLPGGTVVDLTGISQYSSPLPWNFAAGAFIGEGAVIPTRQGSYAGMTVGPVRKIALLAALSDELETSSGDIATAIISNALSIAVHKGLDAVLLSNAAADADSPAGLLFGVTAITGSASMSADLGALVAEIAEAGIDTSSVVFVCSPAQAISLSLLAGPKFSHPIVEASGLADGTVIAVAVSALVSAGEGDPIVDISKQAVVHMDTAPQNIGEAAGVAAPSVSMFQSNSLALRCVSRLTWSIAPGATALLTGATW